MPFQKAFEKSLNRHMQRKDGDPSSSGSNAQDDTDLKKVHEAARIDDENEDIELSEKKDRPPRFSTLFEPARVPMVQEHYSPPSHRRSGVHLPLPLFIVLALILFFESTLLFAYTVIGLYNNLPRQLLQLGSNSVSSTTNACDCDNKQPSINIAPNFFMQGGSAGSDDPLTSPSGLSLSPSFTKSLPASTTTTSTSLSSSSSSSSSFSSSSSTRSSSINTLQAASDILSLFGSQHTTTSTANIVSVIVTATPSPTNVVTSVQIVDGPTVSSETTIATTIGARSESSTAPVADGPAATSSPTTTTPTTLVTSPSPTTPIPKTTAASSPSPSSATSTKGTVGACFGAGGAVGQVCPDGI